MPWADLSEQPEAAQIIILHCMKFVGFVVWGFCLVGCFGFFNSSEISVIPLKAAIQIYAFCKDFFTVLLQ